MLLQLSMIFLAHHSVALSVHTQFSQADSQALPHHENNTECPSVWYEYNEVTHDCQCIGLLFLKCEGENTYADTRHIFTYNSTRRIISAVKMRHKYLKGYNLTVTKRWLIVYTVSK